MERYVVHDRTEETECETCGWPMFVGDTVWMTADGHVGCSAEHARAASARRKENRQ